MAFVMTHTSVDARVRDGGLFTRTGREWAGQSVLPAAPSCSINTIRIRNVLLVGIYQPFRLAYVPLPPPSIWDEGGGSTNWHSWPNAAASPIQEAIVTLRNLFDGAMINVVLKGADDDVVDARVERGNIQLTIGGQICRPNDTATDQV